MLIDGETGILFPTGNIEALAELTVTLGADPVRRAAVGQKARASMDSRRIDDAVQSYLKLFNSTVAAAPSVL